MDKYCPAGKCECEYAGSVIFGADRIEICGAVKDEQYRSHWRDCPVDEKRIIGKKLIVTDEEITYLKSLLSEYRKTNFAIFDLSNGLNGSLEAKLDELNEE